MLDVLKGLLIRLFEVCKASGGAETAGKTAMGSDGESYPETVAVESGHHQPEETLRAALQATLPEYAIGRVIGTGGISTCFEAFVDGRPRAIKVSHKGVSPRGTNSLVAVLAEVQPVPVIAQCSAVAMLRPNVQGAGAQNPAG